MISLLAALGFALVAILFAFRPTPVLGVDGSSLSRSVNGDFGTATDPCSATSTSEDEVLAARLLRRARR